MGRPFRFAGTLVLLSLALSAPIACGARSPFLESYGPEDGGSAGSSSTGTTTGTTTSTETTTQTTTTTSTTSTTQTTTGAPPDKIISPAPESSFEGETSVVAVAGGTVAAAWIIVSPQGEPAIGYAFSKDDGDTWLPPVSIQSPDGRYGSDPVLAADSAGNMYLTWVAFHVNGGASISDMVVYVAKAPFGSLAFGAPVAVSDPNQPPDTFLDKPWITVTAKDTVAVSYAQFGAGYSLILARSGDGGASFSRSTIIEDGSGQTFYNLGYVCASKETGRLYATYIAVQQFGQQIALKNELSFSDDEGASWPGGNHTVVSQGELDVAFSDPTCTALGNDVWVSYSQSKDPVAEDSGELQKLYRINLRHSPDGGVSFPEAMSAEDPSAAPFFIHPDVKHEENGLLDIVYYAGSQDEDPNASFRRARFKFGEVQPPSSVVAQPIVFAQSRAVPYWLGDYVGHFVRGNRVYMTYVYNPGFESHVGFNAFDLN